MKARLYNKITFLEDETNTKPMAETKDGKHYPVFTPVERKDMIGEQEGRVLTIRNKEMFVLDSQQHLLTKAYNKRKFIH